MALNTEPVVRCDLINVTFIMKSTNKLLMSGLDSFGPDTDLSDWISVTRVDNQPIFYSRVLCVSPQL